MKANVKLAQKRREAIRNNTSKNNQKKKVLKMKQQKLIHSMS